MYKLVNGQRKRPSEAQKHGLITLRTAVNLLGGRAVDKRTLVGRALAAWRDEIVADLGGEDNLSAQEKAIISACVNNRLLLNSVDDSKRVGRCARHETEFHRPDGARRAAGHAGDGARHQISAY